MEEVMNLSMFLEAFDSKEAFTPILKNFLEYILNSFSDYLDLEDIPSSSDMSKVVSKGDNGYSVIITDESLPIILQAFSISFLVDISNNSSLVLLAGMPANTSNVQVSSLFKKQHVSWTPSNASYIRFGVTLAPDTFRFNLTTLHITSSFFDISITSFHQFFNITNPSKLLDGLLSTIRLEISDKYVNYKYGITQWRKMRISNIDYLNVSNYKDLQTLESSIWTFHDFMYLDYPHHEHYLLEYLTALDGISFFEE
jgi:hypothetical protein